MSVQKLKEDDEILTIEDVAELLKMSTSYIYKLSMNDDIPFRKLGNKLRFVKREVLDWFNKKTA